MQSFGFSQADVSLSNWRKAPYNQWSFQHVREIVPTAPIVSRSASAEAIISSGFPSRPLPDEPELIRFLEQTETDCFLVLRNGQPVWQWCAAHGEPASPHLLFSVSKSITGIVVGALAELGELDLDALVTAYVPEAAGSAFGDASVRNLLDMRVSMDFDEIYGDDKGWGARYCKAVLWDPADGEIEKHLTLLLEIKKGLEPHGGAFRYRSANSDLLGVVVARAAGQSFQDTARDVLFGRLGCSGESYVTVDSEGTAQAAGGIACTIADLARIGEIMRCEGALGGKQVVPASFVHDTLSGGDRTAWKLGDFAASMPGGSYRNQWYLSHNDDGRFHAVGIHGQWLYVNPARGVTIAKLSSQAVPKDDSTNATCLATFDDLARSLA